MSIVGKWKVKKIMHFEGEEPKAITIEEFEALPEKDEEAARMATTILEISDDGKLLMLLPVPEEFAQEVIADAEKEGIPYREDGFIIADTMEWLEKDGEYYCNSEGMGEAMKMPIDEDGGLEFMGGLLIFEKIE